MQPLIDYIIAHTIRGECQCGRCLDKGPERPVPEHSVDVHFFWVSAIGEPSRTDLFRLLEAHYPDLNRLRGGPSYIEMGGALGDQGIALRLIGLGHLVGLWAVVTPKTLGMTGAQADGLAGQGFVMAGGFLPGGEDQSCRKQSATSEPTTLPATGS